MSEKSLQHLLDNNQKWADAIKAEQPDFFEQLAGQQTPQYLWIGCADSRVPANQVLGMLPGDVFVHRNIANLVVNTDISAQSVIQYAVEVLQVKHVIVCGHYGCGGVQAAMTNQSLGLIDNWLRNIKDTHQKFAAELAALPDDDARFNRLCELNVLVQAENVCHTQPVQQAWQAGRELQVHSWIYDLKSGVLKDLESSISGMEQVEAVFQLAFS